MYLENCKKILTVADVLTSIPLPDHWKADIKKNISVFELQSVYIKDIHFSGEDIKKEKTEEMISLLKNKNKEVLFKIIKNPIILSDAFYVIDGRHRMTIAKELNVEFIDAYVACRKISTL